jgi:UDP-glucose 4-epimerase
MKNLSVVVTGGAGFIGSHVAERLLIEGSKVHVIDDFSAGSMRNLEAVNMNPSLVITKADLKRPLKSLARIFAESDLIFHLAANPEVRVGETQPTVHFEENILATYNLLEAIRKTETPKTIIFASTSTVYGDALEIPTPETYGPLIPISTYGASKLACEALIMSYASTFNHHALILRLANIVGPRSGHGVIPDFVKKIRNNPNELTILGDGTQRKSYMHIEDCIDSIIHLTKKVRREKSRVDIYNAGSEDSITTKEIAEIVAQEMKVPDIALKFTGGVDGGRGWRGDVKTMQLSILRLLQTGWKPKRTSEQAVRLTARALKGKMRRSPRSTC